MKSDTYQFGTVDESNIDTIWMYDDLADYLSGEIPAASYEDMPEFVDIENIQTAAEGYATGDLMDEVRLKGAKREDFYIDQFLLPCFYYNLEQPRVDIVDKFYPPEQQHLDVLWVKNMLEIRGMLAVSENLVTLVLATKDRVYFNNEVKAHETAVTRPSYFHNNIPPFEDFTSIFNPHKAAIISHSNFLRTCDLTGLAVYTKTRLDGPIMKRKQIKAWQR